MSDTMAEKREKRTVQMQRKGLKFVFEHAFTIPPKKSPSCDCAIKRQIWEDHEQAMGKEIPDDLPPLICVVCMD
jgi:hypothetical protein